MSRRAVAARARLKLAALLLLTGSAAFIVGRALAPSASPFPHGAPGFLWPDPPTLTPFTLMDERAAPFTETSLDGHWSLLFFGYTHCPDICPLTLALLARVHAGLRERPAFAQRVRVFLISLDAARDTPQILGDYVRHFDPDFHAATASPEALHLLTRQLAAGYTRVSTEEGGDYWFDHSPAIFLVAPDRRVVGAFIPPHSADDLLRQIRQIARFIAPGA